MLAADPPTTPLDLRPLFRAAARDVPPLPSVDAFLAEIHHPTDPQRTGRSVRETLVATSADVTAGNFRRIRGTDLEQTFDLYAERAFQGCLAEVLPGPEPRRPRIRFSGRMTRSAGITTLNGCGLNGCGHEHPDGRTCRSLEIALSKPLILGSFLESPDPVSVGGLACNDRLDVLLRVFEHELVHVFELAAFGASSCSGRPFRALAWALFGHTISHHEIMSPRARARAASGLRPGDRVRFEFEGVRHTGVVNRITRRATVLVKAADGEPYDDGHRYRKFYVPLDLLRHLDPAAN